MTVCESHAMIGLPACHCHERAEYQQMKSALARWLAAWDALEIRAAIDPEELEARAAELQAAYADLERVARRCVGNG